MKYTTGKTDYKAITEAIGKLKTLKEKLQYYNDNYQILILRNVSRSLNAKIIYYNDYTVYCTCKDCESKFLITDFEVYRDFVNNQTDAIVKYFNETTNYKAKLEYYYKLNDGYPQKTKLVLKYVPNSKDDVKDYYNLKEVSIDVTPQNEIEFNILLDLKKSIILNSENNQKPQRTPIHKGTEYYNASRFIYENRVDEVTNYLELIVDENDRKDLIKKYLDSVNLDKIDFEKIKIKRKFTYEFLNYEILKIANKIIQKINYDEVVNTTIFFEVENYLLALETIKFKKHLNSLLLLIPQQNQTDEVTSFTKNNFDPENAKPKKVYDYFKKELVDTGYLSLEDLEKYLIMAFQDKTAPAERFSFAKKIKVKEACAIFYRYYTVIANAGNGNKMKYAELLGNYFTGYIAKQVYNNFRT
ncbi:conserved hypothetical protein [Flavobacterium psychrophilum]|uniref:hypothetical protein n=1 Tax=Flavobacterium psychrophilum TaxID=96345 RepID=UPI000B7C1C1C|nr:hypothetical protein [Flavobacterium psychrophilum]GEJ35846.1 hypothetical protein FPN184_contig00045-0014 [Flavobacterium psychrophilum]GEJ49675.1 hypothetical protein FPKKA176_contig00033-0014 [Flavobacterium psychrophilum]SNB16109.1 conserved hypothetical protein [Flavobacterium psychrophilum]